jgi:hypothetical protein
MMGRREALATLVHPSSVANAPCSLAWPRTLAPILISRDALPAIAHLAAQSRKTTIRDGRHIAMTEAPLGF